VYMGILKCLYQVGEIKLLCLVEGLKCLYQVGDLKCLYQERASKILHYSTVGERTLPNLYIL
jgi:hypothetical protein